MAFFEQDEIHDLYVESKAEGLVWREDYHEYERLADNDLMEDLDENLPEVNDGSLAASLFKLPKRIVSSKLEGRAKALDADDAWITELANMHWKNKIIPNAKSQAPFHRKWKDAVRKAAIYGGQPIITLFVERGNYTGADFIVPLAQDVTLEAGKISDEDSDIIFWDVYYSKKQVRDMIEQAKAEKESGDGYNKWNVKALQGILDSKAEEERNSQEDHNKKQGKGVKKSGVHFYIAFQRGVGAPFYMCHATKEGGKDKNNIVREWENPDPTGDVPVHYLYCYQDFVNPYGIGIVKLAGGTQNVLDYFRQADVLATQLGVRPPKMIEGDADEVDEDSMVYAEDANWYVGNAKVTRMEMSNGVYQQLPERIQMYKSSLNNLMPMGDTSVSAGSGDPLQSKTPAGVKLAEANLSIDDDDFKDNLYMTYEAVAKSMINTDFANRQGSDIMKLSDEEREILAKAGLEFPVDEMGNPSNELEVIWDEARATFEFEMNADLDKAKDDTQRLTGLTAIADFIKDPNTQMLIQSGQPIILGNKKLDPGELIAEIVNLASDNDKIIQDVTPEDQEAQAQAEEEANVAAEQEAMAMQEEPVGEMPMGEEQLVPEEAEAMPMEPEQTMEMEGEMSLEDAALNVQAVMERFGVDEGTAAFALEAERNGLASVEEALEYAGQKVASEQEMINV